MTNDETRRRIASETLNEALWKIDDELRLDANEPDTLLLVKALIDHVTAIAVGQWEPDEARAIISDIVGASLREAEGCFGEERRKCH
jgi:hypothetical protein